jgi:hypothetical protein
VSYFSNAVAELRARLDREQRRREGREDPGERFGRNRVSGERAPAVKVADHVLRRRPR